MGEVFVGGQDVDGWERERERERQRGACPVGS